jgi:hypothetical protein
MAYVYPLQKHISIPSLVDTAVRDARFDTISWKNGEWIEVIQGGTATKMRFRLGSSFTDVYSQKWDIEGDWSVLDLKPGKKADHVLDSSYPDVC